MLNAQQKTVQGSALFVSETKSFVEKSLQEAKRLGEANKKSRDLLRDSRGAMAKDLSDIARLLTEAT